MTSRTLHAALIQHTDQGSPTDNLGYIETQITEVAGHGAELILLQELHNTAYFCQVEDVAAFDLAEPIPGPTTERLGALARRLGVVIVGSLFERRAPGLHHNTAVVIERDGSLAGRYRKMHIPDDPGYHEKFYFAPGDLGFHPIDTSVGRLGVLVCWDQWYPEAARLMALAGAELLLFPTAIGWDARDDSDERQRQLDAWLTVQRAHAIANGLPLLSCNRSGREVAARGSLDGIGFWGHSFACGPQGEWLGRAGEGTETLHVHIALQRGEQVRRIWPFLRDRRIDAYADLQKRYRDDC
jgi:N-carbamoylputrescine amidase